MMALVIGGTASAQTLSASDILSQFNLVTSGNFSSSSDVEGRAVIGGNMTGGATFNLNPESTASTYGAVNVFGSVSSGNYNINNGGNVNVAGTNSGTFNMNGGGTISKSVPGGSYASVFNAPLTALSSQLDALTANNVLPTTASLNGNFNNVAINATNVNSSGIAVFDTTASQLSQYSSFNVNMDSAKTVVINVTGNYSQNQNFNNDTDNTVDSHVIWNFVDASSVNLQGFGGTVLAENATVTNSSAVNGDVVAANYTGNGELHDHAFAGVLPTSNPAPLPPLGGSIASLLGIVGFTMLGIRRRRAA